MRNKTKEIKVPRAGKKKRSLINSESKGCSFLNDRAMTTDPRLKKIITEVTDRILKGYKPKKVILFGSYAYGEPTDNSDIDLLIIKDTDKRPIDRWIEVKKLLRDISRTVPVSPLVYTEKEIEQRIAIKDFFIEEIFEKGDILYG